MAYRGNMVTQRHMAKKNNVSRLCILLDGNTTCWVEGLKNSGNKVSKMVFISPPARIHVLIGKKIKWDIKLYREDQALFHCQDDNIRN